MTPNFEEILLELSYRVPTGIVDLTNEEHLDELVIILEENRIYNSKAINALREKAKAKTKAPAKKVLNKIKPKSTSSVPNAGETLVVNKKSGAVYPVKKFNSTTQQKASAADIRKAKAAGKFGKNEPEKKVKTGSINITGAEKRIQQKVDKTEGPLAKDLNKALVNISDAKKAIQIASVQKGKMSQNDLDAVIDVATKIAKGIDLNQKDKKVADTYIRIKDKKEDTSIYILFPPFNTQNHKKVKMGNLDRLLAYGKKNGVKRISEGGAEGSDATTDKQKLPKKAMAGANINKKTTDTIIKSDKNSFSFGKTGTKVQKAKEYSESDKARLIKELIKKGNSPEKAKEKVERLATEIERVNKVVDFFRKSPNVKTLDFGAEPTTDEGRNTILRNSKEMSIAQFEKFFKAAGGGKMTSDEKKVLDTFNSIKSPYDNPNWNRLSPEQKKVERDRYENEMEQLLGTMMKTPSFRQGVPDFAEVIRYNIYLGQGLEAYLPADSTFQISDIIVFTPTEKMSEKDLIKNLSESANLVIESLVFTGGVSEKVMDGGAPSGEERLKQSVFKNGDGSFNTQERLLDNMKVYGFTFRNKDKFLEDNPRKREDWAKLSVEEQAKLLRKWEDDMNQMPSDKEFSLVQNQLDKTLEDALKAGIITPEEVEKIKAEGKHQGELLVNKAKAKGAGNCLDKKNLEKYHNMLRMWTMMGAICEKINNNDLKYTLFKNNREMFDSKGNFKDNEVIDGVNIKPGMKWKYDPGIDVTASVPSISEKHKSAKNGPRGCKFLAMNNPNSASIKPIK